ncbi:bestrophin family protein [Terrimonas pollutisoli]|uniref:bestrophin family protein n=1 Tax=Terrimonas pollutisoli TaxID=3034147 RepID=UPI0023EDCEE5|nr:bestrophin family ion channel [Terrimonas sp. H1YJ31]
MISYNPKDWFTYLFRFHKADTVRKLAPLIIGICVYSALIAFLELEYWKLSANSYVKNIPVMHTLLGFAISMLLVFRTNTAYDRWWEGRKLWGSLVNNSRNLALKLSSFLAIEENAQRSFFRKIIPAYAYSLHNHLHSEKIRIELFEDEEHGHVFKKIDQNKHVPNQIALLIFHHVQKLYKENKITGDQLIVLNSELQSFTDICGACERIKNTPIPFSYSVFIKKFIFIYVMTLPFGYVFSLGYYVIPVVAIVFYVLASLELIAEEIEDPFGGDPNDVPSEKLAATIHRTIAEII